MYMPVTEYKERNWNNKNNMDTLSIRPPAHEEYSQAVIYLVIDQARSCLNSVNVRGLVFQHSMSASLKMEYVICIYDIKN